MKTLTKLGVLALFVGAVGFTSCSKDTCYECTGFDDGTESLEDLGTVCEGDTDDDGNEITKEALEAAVGVYQLLGGTCNKK